MDELQRTFKNRPMSEATQKSHIQTYKKIHELYDITQPLHTLPLNVIQTILKNDTLSPSYKNKIVSLFIILKTEFKDDKDLPKLKELLKESSNDKIVKKVEDFKKIDTDLYDDIEAYIHSPSVVGNPQKFITNWLVFYLNTRNADLICKIVMGSPHDGGVDGDTTLNNDTNYLIYYPNRIEFIRNNYKTSSKYGSKINTITDPLFIEAFASMPLNDYLLVENPKSIGNAVMRKLYTHNGKHMTEVDYLYNNINRYKNDINALKRIEHNRGTDLNTLLTAYNKEFKNEKYPF
jgi:hypothetical protein